MPTENELMHYGILGMHWGKRKASSSDSSTTKKMNSADYKEARSLKKKGYKSLSNAELKKYNERLNLEKQFKDLSKQEQSKGKKFISDVLANSGKTAATTLATAAIVYGGKKLIAAKFGEDVVGSMFKKK